MIPDPISIGPMLPEAMFLAPPAFCPWTEPEFICPDVIAPEPIKNCVIVPDDGRAPPLTKLNEQSDPLAIDPDAKPIPPDAAPMWTVPRTPLAIDPLAIALLATCTDCTAPEASKFCPPWPLPNAPERRPPLATCRVKITPDDRLPEFTAALAMCPEATAPEAWWNGPMAPEAMLPELTAVFPSVPD